MFRDHQSRADEVCPLLWVRWGHGDVHMGLYHGCSCSYHTLIPGSHVCGMERGTVAPKMHHGVPHYPR